MSNEMDEKAVVSIEPLMTKAEKQGFVTLDDIMEVFPEAENNLEGLEELFISLSEEGIQVVYRDEQEEEEEEEEEEVEEDETDSESDSDESLQPKADGEEVPDLLAAEREEEEESTASPLA
ncbi:MAG: hypothetical protein GX573_27475, partial [Chloroflexi bacterium]|nr:hypothetical protein [Chloroflexota bacterium]